MAYRLNFHPSPPDPRDFKVKLATAAPGGAAAPLKAAPLPASADLVAMCTTIKDQGQVGACTAFATVGAMEYMEKRFNANPTADIFSERFTYYVTRVDVAGWSTEDSGAYIRDAIKSVAKYGTCKEGGFPFNGDYKQRPSAANYTEATKFKALTYATFDSASKADMLQAVKRTLAAGYPVVGGFTCFSNIWNAVKGVIPPANGQVIGGHAILFVGYNDATRQLKFKNSWTSRWGDNGYGYLSYDYILQGNASDLWAIYTSLADAKTLGLDVVDPRKEKQDLQKQLSDVMTYVAANIVNATDKTKTDSVFAYLLNANKANPKVVGVINSLRAQFRALSS